MKKGGNHGDKEEDGALWHRVTEGIKAYKPPAKTTAAAPPARSKNTPKPPSPAALPAKASPAPKGFDRATETKLRKGRLALEGRLDLHGMTQTEAFDALRRFIRAAVAAEKRTVLVITGKGNRSEGILKRMLPLWLEDPEFAPYLIALTPAQPKDGGSGAFYLRLRKSTSI